MVGAAVVIAAVGAGVIGTMVGLARALQEERHALAAKADLEKANEKLKQSRDEAFQEKRRANERAAEAKRNEEQARNRSYISDMWLAQRAWDDAQIGRLLGTA